MFTLDLPKTTNAIYHTSGGKWYKDEKQKVWEQSEGWKIKEVWKRKPLKNHCFVGIHLYLKRDRDIDGSIKPILDLLERCGVYENDRQIVHLIVLMHIDTEFPRVEVEVEEIG